MKWTTTDEKKFQQLLKRRQRVSRDLIKKFKVSLDTIDQFKDTQDYDGWKHFMNYTHPDVVEGTLQQLKEFDEEEV